MICLLMTLSNILDRKERSMSSYLEFLKTLYYPFNTSNTINLSRSILMIVTQI